MASHNRSPKGTPQNLVDLLFEAELLNLYGYVERLVFEETNLVHEAFHKTEKVVKTRNDDGSPNSGLYARQSIKMMSMMGWREGQGLGAKKDGVKDAVPILNRVARRGLGYTADKPDPRYSMEPKDYKEAPVYGGAGHLIQDEIRMTLASKNKRKESTIRSIRSIQFVTEQNPLRNFERPLQNVRPSKKFLSPRNLYKCVFVSFAT